MTLPTSLPSTPAVLATLLSTEGSSPREAGASMWVDGEGHILGSVTIGGCVDARVIEEAATVLQSGQPSLLSLSLGDEDALALGMTCGGVVEVMVERVESTNEADPVVRAAREAEREVTAGRHAVTVASLPPGRARLLVREDGSAAGTLGDEALEISAVAEARALLGGGRSGVRTVRAGGESVRLFFLRHVPPLSLVVFGATHVAIPLVALARVLGLRTVVVDGRERFATRERFPTADEVRVGMPSELAEQMSLGRTSLVVLLAHDYKYDLPVLRAVLQTPAAYVGVLGSARRGAALLRFLEEEGVSAEQLARVRVPVGLDIGATSAEEIALSVLAEALAVQRGRSGGAMRDRRRSPAVESSSGSGRH